MIERLFIKDCLSFEKIDLQLEPGLVVFTGASGVGKTVLMKSILALTGNEEAEAVNSELVVKFPFDLENYSTSEESSTIQQSKKEKNRFFLNDLTISKKKLSEVTSRYIDFMNVRDFSIFEDSNMLNLLDSIVIKNAPSHSNTLADFKSKFKDLDKAKKDLEQLLLDKERVEDIRGFLEFEINKILEIGPTDDQELEDLNKIKNQIVNKTKIAELIGQTEAFFDNQRFISNLFDVLEVDCTAFEEAMNDAYAVVQDAQSSFDDLDYVDIDEVMSRQDKLNSLVKKYGSITECLEILQEKENELEKFSDVEFQEQKLIKEVDSLKSEIDELDNILFVNRSKYIEDLNLDLSKYSDLVLLENVSLELKRTEQLTTLGRNSLSIFLNGTDLTKVSAGELNRLKLATLVLKSKHMLEEEGGVLILDEIDSNLSGKESESVGKLLHILSSKYQILSISHQPQLTSFAKQHFLVQKENGISSIVELSKRSERESEIARMISGNDITEKALGFAGELIFNSNNYMRESIS